MEWLQPPSPGDLGLLRGDSGVLAPCFGVVRWRGATRSTLLPSPAVLGLRLRCPSRGWRQNKALRTEHTAGSARKSPPVSIFLSGRRYSHLRFPSVFGWNRQTGRVDKGCLFIEQLLKKKKTQMFLVINVKSFSKRRCVARKRERFTPLTQGRTRWRADEPFGTRPCCGEQGAALLRPAVPPPAAPQPRPQATPTQDTVFTDHRFPHHDTPCPQSTDLELEGQK